MQDNTDKMIFVGKVHFMEGKKVGEVKSQKRAWVHLPSPSPCGTEGISAVGREHTCL